MYAQVDHLNLGFAEGMENGEGKKSLVQKSSEFFNLEKSGKGVGILAKELDQFPSSIEALSIFQRPDHTPFCRPHKGCS